MPPKVHSRMLASPNRTFSNLARPKDTPDQLVLPPGHSPDPSAEPVRSARSKEQSLTVTPHRRQPTQEAPSKRQSRILTPKRRRSSKRAPRKSRDSQVGPSNSSGDPASGKGPTNGKPRRSMRPPSDSAKPSGLSPPCNNQAPIARRRVPSIRAHREVNALLSINPPIRVGARYPSPDQRSDPYVRATALAL